jgi:L-aminopeptidase/D-esterase-like protein
MPFGMESPDTLPPEKIAFIAFNIGVYESVQKFGQLITNGKITNNTDMSKVVDLLSESIAIYDAEMISGIINSMLRHTNNNTINKVTAEEVRNIMNQLKAVGVSIP